MSARAAGLVPATRNGLALLLLAMADDELVLGFGDSEWTGIAPLLEEDVAMSSLAQDELGHAQALYRLLAEVVDDGRDADAIAYDRPPEGYYHARLLDHPRGDWATAIARRYLYDTADAVRLEALAASSFEPLRDLVGKIRREERYHLMHADAWLERLARGGEPRDRLLDGARRASSRTRGRSCRRCPTTSGSSWPGSWTPRTRSSMRAGGRRSRRPSSASTSRNRGPPAIRTVPDPVIPTPSAGCGAS